MKNHLEGKEFFNDETILDKIHIDFKESIILNTESKFDQFRNRFQDFRSLIF